MDRREQVLKYIQESDKPLSATTLAKKLSVSRQIIVGDVALLRASGMKIIATPRGYVCQKAELDGILKTVAVAHFETEVEKELNLIVDMGGEIVDVIVEHPLYGQLSANLHIHSRYDVQQFMEKLNKHQAQPLSKLTNGLHLHTIRCKDEDAFQRIFQALQKESFIYTYPSSNS